MGVIPEERRCHRGFLLSKHRLCWFAFAVVYDLFSARLYVWLAFHELVPLHVSLFVYLFLLLNPFFSQSYGFYVSMTLSLFDLLLGARPLFLVIPPSEVLEFGYLT